MYDHFHVGAFTLTATGVYFLIVSNTCSFSLLPRVSTSIVATVDFVSITVNVLNVHFV